MTIRQYRVSWDGLPGGKGFNVFYSSTAVDLTNQFAPLYDAIKQYFPIPLVWNFDGVYHELDETNGRLTNVVSSSLPGSVAATSNSGFSPQSGAQIKWVTTGFPDGRRVVGRSYMVPIIITQYDTVGKLLQPMCNTINAAADALRSRAGGEMVVWHRPILKKSTEPGIPDTVVRPGSAVHVTGTICPRQPVTLNSRRDT